MKYKGLFINNTKSKDSIYESGEMVYNCLKFSSIFQIEHLEISVENRNIPLGYDFYLFNYHPITMSWLDTKKLKNLDGIVMTLVLEVLPNNPFVMCPKNDFHAFIVLDPTLSIKNKKVFPFPRPLENLDINITNTYKEKNIPVIGTFGFATKGKGFQHVVDAVNKEFEEATIRINIPFGDFVPNSKEYAYFLGNLCKQRAKKGISVEVTYDYMSKEKLILWCNENTLNCFLYDRNQPGLATTTDQAVFAERPLAISQNSTFRHILQYLKPYPEISLKESIKSSLAIVYQMKKNWSSQQFVNQFEKLLCKKNPPPVYCRKLFESKRYLYYRN